MDARLAELSQTLELSRAELIRHIVAPGALPQVLVGLRQSLGVAWLALMVAEQVNANADLGLLIEGGAADGFNIMAPALPSGLEAFVEHVTSFSSASLEPPLVSFYISHGYRRDTRLICTSHELVPVGEYAVTSSPGPGTGRSPP